TKDRAPGRRGRGRQRPPDGDQRGGPAGAAGGGRRHGPPGPRVAHAARVHRHDARPAGTAQGRQHRLAVRPLLPRCPGLPAQGPSAVATALLGPILVLLTLVLLASGIGLLLASSSWLPLLLKVHK